MKVIARRSVLIGGVAAAASALTSVDAQTTKDEQSSTPDPTPNPTPVPWTTKHSVSEQLLYTTVMMNTVDSHGNKGSGTASIVQLFSEQARGIHVLLTNKLVLASAVSATIRLDPISVGLRRFESSRYPRPTGRGHPQPTGYIPHVT
jgi:hypothetical protein